MVQEHFIQDIYQDFILSREAKLCTQAIFTFSGRRVPLVMEVTITRTT